MLPPWRFLIRRAAPGGTRAKLLVFIFHRVLAQPDPLLPGEPDGPTFDWMVRYISRTFTVLPFGTAIEQLYSGNLPAAAACITFDDGYRDNHSVALPILKHHGVQATFFIATNYLGKGRMWNDDVIEAVRAAPDGEIDWREFDLGPQDLSSLASRQRCMGEVLGRLKYFPHAQRTTIARQLARQAGIPDESSLMMSHEEVRQLRAAGMEIGGHTRSHPILSGLSEAEALAEIAGGKADLETILSEPVTVFAYPNGNPERDLSSRDARLIKTAGYQAAATTAWGVATPATDAYMIPRFTPWDRSYHRFAARTLATLAR